MDKELTESQLTFLNGSTLWSKGALFQGKRLLSTLEQSNKLDLLIFEQPQNYQLYQEQIKQINEIKDILRYEEDFFILALHNTIFFLSHAANTFAGFRKIVDEIENVNGKGQVKDVRDMRVHIDEYSKGKGGVNKDNARFIYESPDDLYPAGPFADHLFIGDATTSMIFSDAYLIGDRINVQKTLKIIDKLLPDIIKKCKKYMFPPMEI